MRSQRAAIGFARHLQRLSLAHLRGSGRPAAAAASRASTSARAFHSSSSSTRSMLASSSSSRSSLARRSGLRQRRSFAVQTQVLADIGEGIVEVEVLEWFKQPGDEVKQFDKICSVQSDKANVDITSRYDGVLKSAEVAVGDMAQVGNPLFTVDDEQAAAGGEAAVAEETVAAAPSGGSSESITPPPPAPEASTPSPSSSLPSVADGKKKVLTTPAVRAMAKRHSLDLTLITPTGPKGRITKEDVLNFLENKEELSAVDASAHIAATLQAQQEFAAAAASSGRGADEYGPGKAKFAQPLIPQVSAAPEDKVIKVRGLRRAMVQSMTKSASIPQFLYTDEVRADAVMNVRRDLKPVLAERGVRLTLMPFFIKAASLALLHYPILNSSVNGDLTEIKQIGRHNISVAMDSPHGLIVPNIKDCHAKSIAEIASDLARLQALSTEGKLGQEDLADGTFSLSNIGSVGGTVMHPIVFPPQVAIGALGKIRQVPLYDDNMNLVPTQVMHASWSADHRIIDGATMARFANLWKLYVEQPHRMVMDMR